MPRSMRPCANSSTTRSPWSAVMPPSPSPGLPIPRPARNSSPCSGRFTVAAPAAGLLKYRLKLGDYVNPGTLVAHIGEVEVRCPVPGEVRCLERRDGSTVRSGDPLVDLSADKNHVWEALRALYLVGDAADLEDVERYARPVAGMPETVVRQAALTAQAIRSRKPTP